MYIDGRVLSHAVSACVPQPLAFSLFVSASGTCSAADVQVCASEKETGTVTLLFSYFEAVKSLQRASRSSPGGH